MVTLPGWGPWSLYAPPHGWRLETHRFRVPLLEIRYPDDRRAWMSVIALCAGYGGPSHKGLAQAFWDLVGPPTATIAHDRLRQRARELTDLHTPAKEHSLSGLG